MTKFDVLDPKYSLGSPFFIDVDPRRTYLRIGIPFASGFFFVRARQVALISRWAIKDSFTPLVF